MEKIIFVRGCLFLNSSIDWLFLIDFNQTNANSKQ